MEKPKLNKEMKAFITDFKALLKKHDVEVELGDNYGHNEKYLGTTLEFWGNKKTKNGCSKIFIDSQKMLIELLEDGKT